MLLSLKLIPANLAPILIVFHVIPLISPNALIVMLLSGTIMIAIMCVLLAHLQMLLIVVRVIVVVLSVLAIHLLAQRAQLITIFIVGAVGVVPQDILVITLHSLVEAVHSTVSMAKFKYISSHKRF